MRKSSLIRLVLFVGMLLLGQSSFATPVRCSPGYQDNTCLTPISQAPTPQPQCSTGAGWTTVAASTWIGSQWSAPQCNYQAPPTCPGGFTQIASPSWNGSAWVGLGCQPNIPPATPADQQAACAAAAGGGNGPGMASRWSGPQSETPAQVNADIAYQDQFGWQTCNGPVIMGAVMGGPMQGAGAYDVYKYQFGSYVNPNDGLTYGRDFGACMLTPGTAQVVGFEYFSLEDNGPHCN